MSQYPIVACLEQQDDSVTLRIWAKPKASRSKLGALREGALEIFLAAPPVEGEANAELLRLLSKCLGVSKSRMSLVQGLQGRNKTVRFESSDFEQINSKLQAHLTELSL